MTAVVSPPLGLIIAEVTAQQKTAVFAQLVSIHGRPGLDFPGPGPEIGVFGHV